MGGRTFGKERGVVGGRSIVAERGIDDRGVVGRRSGKEERGVVAKEDRGVVGERSPVGKEGRLATGVNKSFTCKFFVKAGNGFNVGGSPSGVDVFLYIRIDRNYFLILFTVLLCSFINRLDLCFVRSHTFFLK